MQTEIPIDVLDAIELQLVEDYQKIIGALEAMKSNLDNAESGNYEIENLKTDIRACTGNTRLASSNLNEVCQNLKHNQEKVLRIIGELPETLVKLPAGSLNQNTYKDSLLSNIRHNLELLKN